ncbi:MAG: isopeptide-forming domain-containing fimbrial protein, partial [Verrucomicrobiota bacterium]
ANGGVIANAGSATLTFDVEATDVCANSGAGSVSYEARYTNGCGDAYTIPQTIGSIAAAADTPAVSLEKEVSESRIAIIESGTYTLTLSATNRDNIATDPLIVTDTLPAGVTYAAHTASIGSVNVVGQIVTWTVSKAALAADQTLEIDFTVDNEPCIAGDILTNTATVSATSSQGCAIGASANATFLVSNNPGLASSQFFNVTPAAPDGIFETGVASADDTRDDGEGEFIPFEANYEFGAMYPGTWVGTTYEDDFAGVSQQTLVPGTLTYRFNGGGATPVPPASITPLAIGFRIDLSFLGTTVAGTELQINYETTIPDAALGGGATRALTQRTHLVVAGIDPEDVPGGICDEVTQFRFTQGAFYTVGRAAATIGLSMASQLEVCREETLTITIGNGNAENAHNVFVTLLNDGTEFIYPAAQVPVYGGAFNAGNITYTANAGDNPTFQYTGDPLTASGTIQVRVIRRATSPVNTSGFSARVDYDSSQTDAAGSRVYSDSASYAPSVVRKANLALTVTPGSITVAGQTATYVIYVTNTDAGTAYEAKATATLPAGITPNAGLMNTENSGTDVFVSGQDIEFDLGDIPSGTTVVRTVVGDVGTIPGCAITITTEKVQASWGCEGDIFFTTERNHPAFFFPTGKMQVVHDSTNSFASICSEGLVEIVVRNTGATSIENVIVEEILPLAEGLSLKPGSVEIRINGAGGWLPRADPVIVGNNHTWTSAQIAELAQLSPVGATVDGNSNYEVRIRFDLEQTESLAGNSPTLTASATAELACGASVSSPGVGFDITVFQPDVTLVKTGRNLTAGQTAYSETVYGGDGDVIEWRIQVTNTGNLTAQNVRFSDELSGSTGLAEFSTVQGTVGIATLGDPGTAYTANTVETIADLAGGGGSATYYIREQLGNNCVTDSPEARVTWGCDIPGAGLHNSIDEPGDPEDPATIVMLPEISGGTDIEQTITHLNGGRARIDVAITNTGGNAYDLVVTNTFPNADMVLDTTVAPAISGHVATFYPGLTSAISGVTTDNTNTLAPEFTLTTASPTVPMLRFGDRVTITYYVRPVVFDTTTATTFPDLASAEGNPALDPNVPATGNNIVRVDYESSCGGAAFDTDSVSLNLRTPDLDITASSPGNALITGTGNANYTFTIRNNGEAGSIADFITADFPDLGAGWTINSITLTTPGTGGSGGTIPVDGATPFTTAQFGTLSSGQTAVITVNAAYSGTPGPLTLKLRVRGESLGQDGTTAYGDYSLDQRAQRIVGVTLSKDLASTSEPTTSGTNVMVGEEVTYLLRADFFGVEDDLTDVTIRDTPADSNFNAHTNLGYVSHAFTGNDELALTAAAPVPVTDPATVAASRINFTAATITAADINAGTNTFEAELVVRVLNVADNTHNKILRNNLGVEFTYLGQKFRSNNGDDGFSGGTSTGNLHKELNVTVRRPTATIAKTVRNVTTATAFGPTAEGQAGDTLEYRIVVTNPNVANAAPLFSISVEDNVPAKLVLLDTDAGADTTGDDVPDTLTTGIVSGDGTDITFTSANTAIADPGSDLDQLDPGESVTLIYRVTLAATVNPSETLVNSATVTGYTLPAPSGSQTAPLGAQDSVTGSDAITAGAAATATVNIIAINQEKEITDYAALPDDDDRVTIGEQIRYRVTLNLPLGTAPDLSVTDTLPAGLALVGTPVIDIGDDIAADNEPPLFTQTNGGQTLTWTFGETLASGADRSITIDYVAQVRNIAGNTPGTVLTNNAAYNFTGLPGDVINLTQRSVTVAQPSITVTHGVRNATRNSGGPYVPSIAASDAIAPDAGDLLEYQISITNASGANIASAYDFNLTDTMPAGVVYVDGWAGFDALSGVTPPAFATFEPDIDGQLLTWGRGKAAPVNIDIAPGGTLVFHYRVRVIDAGQPLQNYTNAVTVDWTSLDGAPGPDLGDPVLAPGNALGERNGAGTAPNTYLAERDAPVVARNATDLTKTKAGDTLPRDNTDVLDAPADGFRIGDIVTYTLTLPVQEGTLADFTIADTLPAGLAFHDTVSITPATGADGFTYTTPVAGATAPEIGDTGALAWDFGTLVNTGDNDTDNDELVVVYRARVLDPAGLAVTPVNQTQDNTATIAFTLADTSTHTSEPSIAGLTVRQPRLTLAKAIISPVVDALGNHVRRPTDTASYRITISNTGTAPAYNIALTDTLPEGLRDAAPVLTAATRNGIDVLATQTAPTWDNGTGAYVFDLADTELLLPGEELVLTYTVTVDDDDTLRGATLTNSAEIDAFYSLPSGDAEAASRRTYAAVGPETADLVIGLRIDGFVYHDIDLSDARDGAEDWSGLKPTVFANLIADNGGDPIVFRTVTVPPGTGAFAFDYLPPGDFDIILTDSAGNLVAQRPANWLNQNPAAGLIAATINQGTGDLVDQNLGLNQGVYSPVVAPTITKTATGETIPAAGPQTAFRIGDLVTYTVDIFPHEGTNTTFLVTDELPAGLACHDTDSIAQVAGPARYTFVTPAGGNAPAAATEGTITWNFGTFTNAIADPANNTLRITYRARVINTGTDPLAVPAVSPATTTDGPLTNSAEVGYGNTAVSVDPLAAGPATDDITVEQPRLTIAKALTTPALNRLPPEATGTFTVTVTNDGTAPAYNIRVTDTLPVGLRDTAPTLTAATLNGVDVLAGLTPVWTGAAGTYVFNLSNTQILLPGEELVLAYQFTVDEDATRAATLTNSAVVNRYFSKPANDSTQRRQYAATDPATADIIVGLRIAGTVYEDDDLNDALTPGEDWTGATKPTVYVNLIAGGVVVESETIAPGTGEFEFTNLPEDDYTLIVATTPTALVSDRPANWLYRAPNDGTYDLADTDDDLVRNFGFWQDTLETAGITKTQTGGTLPLSVPADGYRIGDLVTYTLDLAPQEGELTNLVVTDVLPAGLAFVETVSIAQPAGAPRYTYVTPAGANAPAADDTGTLTWTFGDFENALNGPADNILRLTYTARILDTGGIAVPAASPATTSATRVNSATLAYDNEDDDPISAGPATATLDVEQPRLIIAKTRLAPVADNIVMSEGTAQFRLTVTNNGTGPAYNVTLTDTLPDGLRDATPVLDNATLNGGAFVPDSVDYVAGTGVWTIALSDAQILLPAGETIVLDYTVTVDADATKGAVLTNSARVASYASKESADADERRVYDPTAPSTQDLIVGMQIDGSVYHQLIPNGMKDDGDEDWTSGTPVVVNLVTNNAINYGGFSLGANQVLRSIAVPVGDGEFTFTNVPAGNYRIIVTDTAVNTTPAVPATWTFDTPATGSITPVAASNADITDQHLGLYQGRIISGRVYNDAAPFGSREAETWAGGVEVVVNLVNTYGVPVVHESITVPAGVGTYEFTDVPPGSYQVIVAPAGQAAATTAAAPANWVFVEPDTGTIGTFLLTTSDVTGQEFGLTLGRTVSGFVFNDTNPNGTKDGFEDWLTGTPVVVNLVRASDNTVFGSANVAIGAGDYEFTNVPPGDFRIIVTNAPGQTTAVAPPSWLFRNPPTGSQNITVAGADLEDRNFAIFRGRTLAGRVFRDNGAGGGAANNGTQTGGEPGIGNVTVRLLSAGLTILDTAQTNGSGDFLLRIPADTADGATLIVEEINPPVHRSTGADVGDSGGTYNIVTDRLTFT